jgi:hypothetical protein
VRMIAAASSGTVSFKDLVPRVSAQAREDWW